MSKLKIEHGASKVNWFLLKTNIEESIAADIDLMCEWSKNDRKYIVNELLRFALAQSEDFQKYKQERDSTPAKNPETEKTAGPSPKARPDSVTQPALPPSSSPRQQ